MTESDWMEKYLNGRTWAWDELVRSGRAPLDLLDDSQLKKALTAWQDADSESERILDSLGYEAG